MNWVALLEKDAMTETLKTRLGNVAHQSRVGGKNTHLE